MNPGGGGEVGVAMVKFVADVRDLMKAAQQMEDAVEKSMNQMRVSMGNMNKWITSQSAETFEKITEEANKKDKAVAEGSKQSGQQMVKAYQDVIRGIKLAFRRAVQVITRSLKQVGRTFMNKFVKNIPRYIRVTVVALLRISTVLASLVIQVGKAYRKFAHYLEELTKKIVFLQLDIRYIITQMRNMSLFLIAAVGGGIAALASFQEAFVRVRRVVDMTEDELNELGITLQELSRSMITSANELAEIAAVGGQLGIEGVRNLRQFTETVAILAETTKITGETGAAQLAKFMVVMQENVGEMDRLASTIVHLGNNFAAFEDEMLTLTFRLSGAAAAIGLTTDQVLALSTAMSAVGIGAERGGTAMSRLMIEMSRAVELQDKTLRVFARTANMTLREFTEAFKNEPIKAMDAFIRGLHRMSEEGENLFEVFEGLEIGQIRTIDALLRLASAGTLLTDTLDHASRAYSRGDYHMEEYEKRMDTVVAQFTTLWNSMRRLGIMIGEVFEPHLLSLADGANDVLQAFIDLDEKGVAAFARFASVILGIVGAIFMYLITIRALLIMATSLVLGLRMIVAIGPILALIWAFTQGMQWLQDQLDDPKFKDTIEAATKLFNKMADGLDNLWEQVKQSELLAGFKFRFETFIFDMQQLFDDSEMETGDWWLTFATNFLNLFAGIIEEINSAIVRMLESETFQDKEVSDAMRTFQESLLNLLSKSAELMFLRLPQLMTELLHKFDISGFVGMIGDMGKQVWAAIAEALDKEETLAGKARAGLEHLLGMYAVGAAFGHVPGMKGLGEVMQMPLQIALEVGMQLAKSILIVGGYLTAKAILGALGVAGAVLMVPLVLEIMFNWGIFERAGGKMWDWLSNIGPFGTQEEFAKFKVIYEADLLEDYLKSGVPEKIAKELVDQHMHTIGMIGGGSFARMDVDRDLQAAANFMRVWARTSEDFFLDNMLDEIMLSGAFDDMDYVVGMFRTGVEDFGKMVDEYGEDARQFIRLLADYWRIPDVDPYTFSSGAILPGFGGGDRVPALLEAGEAVVPSRVVRGGIGKIVQWFRGMGVPQYSTGRVTPGGATPTDALAVIRRYTSAFDDFVDIGEESAGYLSELKRLWEEGNLDEFASTVADFTNFATDSIVGAITFGLGSMEATLKEIFQAFEIDDQIEMVFNLMRQGLDYLDQIAEKDEEVAAASTPLYSGEFLEFEHLGKSVKDASAMFEEAYPGLAKFVRFIVDFAKDTPVGGLRIGDEVMGLTTDLQRLTAGIGGVDTTQSTESGMDIGARQKALMTVVEGVKTAANWLKDTYEGGVESISTFFEMWDSFYGRAAIMAKVIEHLDKLAWSARQAGERLKNEMRIGEDTFAGAALGPLTGVIDAFREGSGLIDGLLNAFLHLAKETEAFRLFLNAMNMVFEALLTVADPIIRFFLALAARIVPMLVQVFTMLGRILENAIFPIFEILWTLLQPIINALMSLLPAVEVVASILSAVLAPILLWLTPIFRAIGWVINYVAKGILAIWYVLLAGIRGIMIMLNKLPIINLNTQIENLTESMQNIRDTVRDLDEQSSELAWSMKEFEDSVDSATQSMTNVPDIFRVMLRAGQSQTKQQTALDRFVEWLSSLPKWLANTLSKLLTSEMRSIEAIFDSLPAWLQAVTRQYLPSDFGVESNPYDVKIIDISGDALQSQNGFYSEPREEIHIHLEHATFYGINDFEDVVVDIIERARGRASKRRYGTTYGR